VRSCVSTSCLSAVSGLLGLYTLPHIKGSLFEVRPCSCGLVRSCASVRHRVHVSWNATQAAARFEAGYGESGLVFACHRGRSVYECTDASA